MAADLVVLLSRLAESPKHDDNARLAMREAAREIAELRQALLFKRPEPAPHDGLSCDEMEAEYAELRRKQSYYEGQFLEIEELETTVRELRQRERDLRAVPKASPRKEISADYATGYNHALETVLAILDKAPTETKDSK